jgi:multicomponent Na+:H+ antiporter subunit E
VKKIILILFSFILWLLLTWTLNWQSLAAGGVVSVAVGLVFGNLFTSNAKKVFQIQRWFWFLVYIPVFLWEMAKANFDVAYRVIYLPKLLINPGIVKVRTNIISEMGTTFLANSITLTPGTFTVDIKDEFLYIHCINVKHIKLEEASKDIVERFEKLLIKIFD